MTKYKLIINNSLNENKEWDSPEWILKQIILELTIPTGSEYMLSKESLTNNLKNLNCLYDIIPFYNKNYKYEQDQKEKNNIINYYKNILGFDQCVDNLLKDIHHKIPDNLINKISSNIIKNAIDLKIIEIIF